MTPEQFGEQMRGTNSIKTRSVFQTDKQHEARAKALRSERTWGNGAAECVRVRGEEGVSGQIGRAGLRRAYTLGERFGLIL